MMARLRVMRRAMRRSPASVPLWVTVPMLSAVQLITACGCRYDGTSMQLNSDSGAPFFGLQLSVRADQVSEGPESAQASGGRRGEFHRVVDAAHSRKEGIAAAGTHDILQSGETGTAVTSVASGAPDISRTDLSRTGSPAIPPVGGAGQLVLTSATSEYRSHVRCSIAPSGQRNDRALEISTRLNGF